MATHDYVIANQSGAAFRTDLNNALAAIVSNNSNSSEPSTKYAYQWWADTSNAVMKIRNSANDGWIELFQLDGTLTLEDGSQTAPALAFRDDLNTGIFSSAADTFDITTGGVEKISISTGGMSINDTGADFDVRIEGDTEQNLVYINAGLERVGMKTASPDALLHLKDTVSPARVHVECTAANSFPGFRLTNDARAYDLQIDGATDGFRIFDVTAATERMRIDTSGNVGVATTDISGFGGTYKGIDLATKGSGLAGRTDNVTIDLRSNTFFDGSNHKYGGTNTTAGQLSVGGGQLIFSNAASGTAGATATLVERARLNDDGNWLVGKEGTTINLGSKGITMAFDGRLLGTTDGLPIININRLSSDGNLVQFYQATSLEGSISVSGSTVSYNGGHLSRWSQFKGISTTDKSARPTIYQGTVMSNLDDLCVWSYPDQFYTEQDKTDNQIPEGKKVGDLKKAAHTEENQQLNMTKISDTEGDKDVAGVFWTWDNENDDYYTNDFFIAMTGDMVIRVAASTTVSRGDLMISAGDGTAKPQADDIIRSSTIAKIISTNATATYADGSKAYPCVLMAC